MKRLMLLTQSLFILVLLHFSTYNSASLVHLKLFVILTCVIALFRSRPQKQLKFASASRPQLPRHLGSVFGVEIVFPSFGRDCGNTFSRCCLCLRTCPELQPRFRTQKKTLCGCPPLPGSCSSRASCVSCSSVRDETSGVIDHGSRVERDGQSVDGV